MNLSQFSSCSVLKQTKKLDDHCTYFPGESAVIRIGIRRVDRDDVDDNKNTNTNTTSTNNTNTNTNTNTNRAKQPIQQLGATLIELTNTDHLL